MISGSFRHVKRNSIIALYRLLRRLYRARAAWTPHKADARGRALVLGGTTSL